MELLLNPSSHIQSNEILDIILQGEMMKIVEHSYSIHPIGTRWHTEIKCKQRESTI